MSTSATGDGRVHQSRSQTRAISVLLVVVGAAAALPMAAHSIGGVAAPSLVRGVRSEDLALGLLALVAAGSLAGWRRAASRPAVDAAAEALRSELGLLREENAKLRLEQQRPLSLGRASERICETATAAVAMADSVGADVGWDALTQAAVMRTALTTICQDLQTAVGHMHLRLSTMTPGPELDRRLDDRRSAPSHGSTDRRATDRQANGHDGELALVPTAPFSADNVAARTA